jgi:NDP-sugar pyrophosphorylase family protein
MVIEELPIETLNQQLNLADIPVLLPVGGQATRARPITQDEIPKHLIELNDEGVTVLDVISAKLYETGFRKFIFCTGYHHEQIAEYINKSELLSDASVSVTVSHETEPLGPDGAVLQAIGRLGLDRQAMVMPADIMLPWEGLSGMHGFHDAHEASITLGLTSYVTTRTTDVGKMVINNQTKQLQRCYGRKELVSELGESEVVLTSAAVMAINCKDYIDLCEEFSPDDSNAKTLSVRDDVLPRASNEGQYVVFGYDLRGEILDLGTPNNIIYAQQNWQQYV